MKRRNAITIASIASIGFGGAAASAMSGENSSTAALHPGASDVVQSSEVVGKPGAPKVVKVFVDDPAPALALRANQIDADARAV